MKRGFPALLALVGCAAGPLLACTERSSESEARPVTRTPQPVAAAEARALLAAGALLVDVREAHELAETGRLQGALHVPTTRLTELAGRGQAPPELAGHEARPVILYCRSGRRSQLSGEMLIRRGFTRIYNLGGFADAVKAGLPPAQDS